MSSRRSRSRSPAARRSQSPDPRRTDLPHGAAPLSADDYFLKSSEFRRWLKDEKDKVRAVWRRCPWRLLMRRAARDARASISTSCRARRRAGERGEVGRCLRIAAAHDLAHPSYFRKFVKVVPFP